MGGYVLDLSFDNETPTDIVERMRHEKPTYEINVDEHQVALLRSKLKYLPPIMHTAIMGPPESEAFQEDLRYFDMLLNAHLKYSGGASEIFTDKAIDEIYKYSAGSARSINKVCTHSLLFAAQRAKKLIDDHMVKTVINGELP